MNVSLAHTLSFLRHAVLPVISLVPYVVIAASKSFKSNLTINTINKATQRISVPSYNANSLQLHTAIAVSQELFTVHSF